MINNKKIREMVVNGLERHASCVCVLANQTAQVPPYPYISFTVTSVMLSNNGTYGVYSDDIERKPVKQVWSFTVQSDTSDEAMDIACMAHDFFRSTPEVLKESGIAVEGVGNVTSRDVLITAEYEYRCGFDVTFTMMSELDSSSENRIETIEINET